MATATKRGMLGLPQKMAAPAESLLLADESPQLRKNQLDERQAAIRLKRRRPARLPDQVDEAASERPVDVPPTPCAEE